jgi:hypothetical protein
LLVCTVYSAPYSEIALSRKPFGIGDMYIYTFCLEWPILWPPRILNFRPGTVCVIMVLVKMIRDRIINRKAYYRGKYVGQVI